MRKFYTNEQFIFNRTKLSLAFIFIATGIRSFWGLFFMCPTSIKIIFSGLIYLSLIIFPFNAVRNSKKQFGKITYSILILMQVLLVFAVIRGLFDNGSAIPGNKYISLFFNEYTLLLFFPPFFTFLASKDELWNYLKDLYFIYLVYGIICVFFLKWDPLTMSIFLIPIFLPQFERKRKLLIYINIIAVFYAGFIVGDRKFIVLLFFCILAYYVYTNSVVNKLVKVIALISVMLPLLLLAYSLISGVSPFELATEQSIKNKFNDSKDFSADSRTFLYVELAQDLTETNSWLFGKGPIGSYYSYMMEQYAKSGDWADSSNRISNEVTFLSFLLKGGLVYVLCCFFLFIFAIIKSSFRAKNKFVQSLSIILCGIYVNSFMGDMAGCSLLQVLIWLIVGTCLSSKWINYTDLEIEEKFKLHY